MKLKRGIYKRVYSVSTIKHKLENYWSDYLLADNAAFFVISMLQTVQW